MHDRNRMNGYHASPTALTLEIQILLGIKEDVGALKASVNQALSNDGEIFEEVRKIRERLKLAEHHAAFGQQLMAPAASHASIKDLFQAVLAALPSITQLVLAALVLGAAVGVIPKEHVAIFSSTHSALEPTNSALHPQP